MIRNVGDVTALLDRRAGSALGRPMSVLRTLVWVVVGLYLFGLLFPAHKVDFQKTHYNTALQKTSVRDLMLDKNDPRGWKKLKKDPSKFTIAWVGGSTIQTVKPHHYGFVPVDVQHRLKTIDGRPVQVNMYLMEASRAFDLYAATAQALASKPDMLVLDLNPLWLFNPTEIQSWDNLNPAALPDLIKRPSNLPLLGSLYSPADGALSLAASHLSSIRDRWSYAESLRKEIDKLSPLTEAPVKQVNTRDLSGTKLIATMQEPMTFWDYYGLIPRDTPTAKRYPAMLRQASTDGSALNDMIVRQLLGTIAQSKIPALAYMSAVDPSTLTVPSTDSALHRVETHLRDLAADESSRTLRVQWQSGSRLVTGLQFRDMVHMTQGGPMEDLLAGAVCRQLHAVDRASQCSATPTTGTEPR